jgi:hypothetical protein
MRWSLVLLLLAITPGRTCAQAVQSSATTASAEESPAAAETMDSRQEPDLVLFPTGDYDFKLGEDLSISAAGAVASRIASTAVDAGGGAPVAIYFNGVRMKLPVHVLQTERADSLLLTFMLTRDASDEDNRKAWDAFLKKNTHTVGLSLSIGNELPLVVYPKDAVHFHVADGNGIWMVVIGVVILVYCLLARTPALRDPDTDRYSLGRSQMAFWGLLVFGAFVGIWIITRTIEPITSQSLVLLGISGATGLGAKLIGDSGRGAAQAELDKLMVERQTLMGPLIPLGGLERLKQVEARIKALDVKLKGLGSRGFLLDICSDEKNRMSFHRLQAVLWTLLLGVIFCVSVATTISMPEFPESLLVLMGISGGTYVGFKIPETAP